MGDRVFIDLRDGLVEIRCQTPSLLARYAASFEPLAITPDMVADRPVDYRISLQRGQPISLPAGAADIIRGDLPGEGYCEMAMMAGTTTLVFPQRASLQLDRSAGAARIIVGPESENLVNGSCGMLPIEEAFDLTGQVLVHAAVLGLPGKPGVMVMFAPSGTGKTTTALALVEAGFGLHSDDAAVLVCGPHDHPHAWGFPRDLHVHRRTSQMLAWTRPMLDEKWTSEDECTLPWANLVRHGGCLQSFEPVRAAYFLERTENGLVSAAPLSATEAMVRAIADNVRVGGTGLQPVQKSRLDALERLLNRVPTRSLIVGADLTSLGDVVRNDLNGLDCD